MDNTGADEQKTSVSAITEEDEAARDRDSREFKLDYKEESANRRKRFRVHEKDLCKACTLTWRCFQLTLRDRIEAQTGFEASIRNNTMDLMLAIKRHALDHEESRS